MSFLPEDMEQRFDARLARIPRRQAFLMLLVMPGVAGMILVGIIVVITYNGGGYIAGLLLAAVLFAWTSARRQRLARCEGCGKQLNIAQGGWVCPWLPEKCRSCGKAVE